MSNFLRRTLTGAAFVSIVILSLITHPFVFAGVTVLLNLIALIEYRRMDKTLSSGSPFWIFVNTGIFSLSLICTVLQLSPAFIIMGSIILMLFFYIHALYNKREQSWDHLVNSVFASIYISLPLFLLNILHRQADTAEIPLVLILFSLIWIHDSFAYMAGIWLGKHRLFERISPKKSWEGFFGGFLATLAASVFLARLYPSLSLAEWLIFGVLCALSAVYGDFIESLLKRSANVKDSGGLLPGHGGILDRIDSVLLVGPVIYLYLLMLNLLF